MKHLLFAPTIALIVLIGYSSNSVYYERPGANLTLKTAILTAYSELDSCHYPVKGGCLTASGDIAGEITIACPRNWELGTKVSIEGKEYVCQDRYNHNLSDRIDIFVGYGKAALEKARSFGVKESVIIVYK